METRPRTLIERGLARYLSIQNIHAGNQGSGKDYAMHPEWGATG